MRGARLPKREGGRPRAANRDSNLPISVSSSTASSRLPDTEAAAAAALPARELAAAELVPLPPPAVPVLEVADIAPDGPPPAPKEKRLRLGARRSEGSQQERGLLGLSCYVCQGVGFKFSCVQ